MNSLMLEVETALHCWLETYKQEHHDQLEHDPEFARWLEESYVPIAGGWHY
jgi:hypothetical protein